MTLWVMLGAAAAIPGFTWLANFFYYFRTPVDRLNDMGQAEAQKTGFRIGFLFAVAIIVVYVGGTQPPLPYW